MANNNISWIGNKVIDTNTYQPQYGKASDSGTYLPQFGMASPTERRTERGEFMRTFIPPEPTYFPTDRGTTAAPPPLAMGGADLPMTQQGPPPSMDRSFIPGYLSENIGKNVRAEFIIGTNQYADRTGRLVEVGSNYFVLHDVNSGTLVMCDLYSVKFVTIII